MSIRLILPAMFFMAVLAGCAPAADSNSALSSGSVANSDKEPTSTTSDSLLPDLAATDPASNKAPAPDVAPKDPEGRIRRHIKINFPDGPSPTIRKFEVAGLYEVNVGGDIYYADSTGDYLIRGDIMEMETQKNLTQKSRDLVRATLMHDLNPKEAIVFSAKSPKHVINVFTDVECGYCRKLHEQIQAYNDNGVTVRYYPFPRSGTSGPVFDEMVSVWCAKDRKLALTQAKSGAHLPAASCANPVAKYFNLGRHMGIQGTPAIFLDNGAQIGGYVPPENITAAIEQALAVAKK
jgi:thiol:disulfide interchange protein DsbC